jgi:hypothetical protein
VGRIVERTWATGSRTDQAALRRVVQRVVVDELIGLASHERASPEARAAAEWGLRRIARLAAAPTADADVQAHRQLVAADIERFLGRRDAGLPHPRIPETPPGVPIGVP